MPGNDENFGGQRLFEKYFGILNQLGELGAQKEGLLKQLNDQKSGGVVDFDIAGSVRLNNTILQHVNADIEQLTAQSEAIDRQLENLLSGYPQGLANQPVVTAPNGGVNDLITDDELADKVIDLTAIAIRSNAITDQAIQEQRHLLREICVGKYYPGEVKKFIELGKANNNEALVKFWEDIERARQKNIVVGQIGSTATPDEKEPTGHEIRMSDPIPSTTAHPATPPPLPTRYETPLAPPLPTRYGTPQAPPLPTRYETPLLPPEEVDIVNPPFPALQPVPAVVMTQQAYAYHPANEGIKPPVGVIHQNHGPSPSTTLPTNHVVAPTVSTNNNTQFSMPSTQAVAASNHSSNSFNPAAAVFNLAASIDWNAAARALDAGLKQAAQNQAHQQFSSDSIDTSVIVAGVGTAASATATASMLSKANTGAILRSVGSGIVNVGKFAIRGLGGGFSLFFISNNVHAAQPPPSINLPVNLNGLGDAQENSSELSGQLGSSAAMLPSLNSTNGNLGGNAHSGIDFGGGNAFSNSFFAALIATSTDGNQSSLLINLADLNCTMPTPNILKPVKPKLDAVNLGGAQENNANVQKDGKGTKPPSTNPCADPTSLGCLAPNTIGAALASLGTFKPPSLSVTMPTVNTSTGASAALAGMRGLGVFGGPAFSALQPAAAVYKAATSFGGYGAGNSGHGGNQGCFILKNPYSGRGRDCTSRGDCGSNGKSGGGSRCDGAMSCSR